MRQHHAYYNENDPFAAAWLRELIAEKLIAPGEVDTRSIHDVTSGDLGGFTQHHFFAGIGGWSYALRLAGWPDDRPVWTGSCPCQPFSAAGKQQGESDPRHLWPEFRRLIAEYQPATVFGEQVASKLGRIWLAGIRADLEALGYAVGAADLCAAGIGAPHIRQRLFWMADSDGGQSGYGRLQPCGQHGQQPQDGCAVGRMEYNASDGWQQRWSEPSERSTERGRIESSGMGHHHHQGSQRRRERSDECSDQFAAWSASVFIPCLDGKFRRVPANEAGEPEPAIFPLAYGISNRVGTLRGAGNAIVPQVAAEFIRACVEAA